MNLLISPFAQKLRNGKNNPKNYYYWDRLIFLLEQKHSIIQIGTKGESKLVKDFRTNLPLKEIKKLLLECDLWISVDSFLPHLAQHVGKSGIVIFGKSDPNIFGYPNNINILKDIKYLRKNQFDIWENERYDKEVFVEPEEIVEKLNI